MFLSFRLLPHTYFPFSQKKENIPFSTVVIAGKGTKLMVKLSELSPLSKEDSKIYVWEKTAKNSHHRKSEWQVQ